LNSIYDPLVSVIVVTYNSSRFVCETLESIKNQIYENIELIISDDCSSDNTIELCSKWIEKNIKRFNDVKILKSKDTEGIASNCNQGLGVARGEWVKLIAGDDMLLPNCLSKYISFVKANPESQVLFSNCKIYVDIFDNTNFVKNSKCEDLLISNSKISARQQYELLLRESYIYAPTVFFQKKCLEDIGGFDNEIRNIEDKPMWLRLTKSGIKLIFVDFYSVNYRIHNSSVQRKRSNLIYGTYYENSFRLFNKYIKDNLSIIEKLNYQYNILRIIFIKKTNLNLASRKFNIIFDNFSKYPYFKIRSIYIKRINKKISDLF
jgi:alpha-1,3-rhamnosyltransferase